MNHGDRVVSGILSYDDLHILGGWIYSRGRAEGKSEEELRSRLKSLKSLSPETLKAEAEKVRSYLRATFGRDLETARAFLARVKTDNIPEQEKTRMYESALKTIGNIEGLERAFKEAEKVLEKLRKGEKL